LDRVGVPGEPRSRTFACTDTDGSGCEVTRVLGVVELLCREGHVWLLLGLGAKGSERAVPSLRLLGQGVPRFPCCAGRSGGAGARGFEGVGASGSSRQKPTDSRMMTTWMRPGSSWWISRIFPTRLFMP